MRASAIAISSSSNLCSGLASALPARGPVLVGGLATRAISVSPFDVVDSACKVSGLSLESSYQLRVLAPFGLGKLANYPTVQAPHVVEADPNRQLLGHIVVSAWRGRRPRSSNQVLFLCGIPRQLGLEPGHTAALVCLQHSYVYTAILFVQLL